jgi:hypothetical protein
VGGRKWKLVSNYARKNDYDITGIKVVAGNYAAGFVANIAG